jgi:PAS domain S-box-containing protein
MPMNTPRIMAFTRPDSPFKVVLLYAIYSALWVVAGDGLLMLWTEEGHAGWLLDSAKGLVFVAVTTGLLYALIKRLDSRHVTVEAELQVSQQRLALALEAANQGLYDLNVQTGEAVVNDTYASMLGYDPKTFRETNAAWHDRLHPEDREKVYQIYSDYVAGRLDAYRVEFRQRTAAGDWRWILSLGRLVERDGQGRPLRMLGTHTDINDLKNAEARSTDSLAFATAVLDSSPMGVLVFRQDGRTVLANESAARIVGTSLSSVLKVNFRQLESWQRHGLLVLAEETLATGKETFHRGPVTTVYGKTIWLEARMVRFIHEGTSHLLLIIRDESEKHDALENLRLLETAVQAAPVGWLVTDPAGVIQWVNPGFTVLTGYRPEEIIGKNPRILKSGRHRPEFYAAMWGAIKRGEVWTGEVLNQRKDGSQYNERMTIAPVRGENGALAHYVAIKQDITAEKQLGQQLARAQRLESIGMLASGIAHDLNNVLTPILLSIELLKIRYPEANARRYVETVENAAQRGAGIVRQVLTFARGMEGGERTEVQPRHLLKDLVRLIEETFPRNITIEYDSPRDVFPVVGDLTQLHQVLLNLAVNARDAMLAGGALTLKARNHPVVAPVDPALAPLKPGEYVAITVTDTGTGIPPEVLDRIFEPFFTTKPRGKGTGLGLSTVYGIVRDHGGVIQVHTKENEGTTFEVILPAAVTEVRRDPVVASGPELQGEGRKILVVDDEEPIRLITSRLLTGRGFCPVEAVDGQDGWREFQAQHGDFAAAIVDEMMPRMSGRDLARHIREVSSKVPVILVTGLMDSGSRPATEVDWKAFGVRIVLHKPYSEAELLKALAVVLGEPPSA